MWQITNLRSRMVRNYKPKTNRKLTSPRKLKAAVALVKAGWSIRKAAKDKGINRQTLFKACKKKNKQPDVSPPQLTYNSRSVLSPEIEKSISDYCIQVAQMGYGLTVLKCRELAFEVAQKNNIQMPLNWTKEQRAGIDWYHGFRNRHPELSVRTPEGCSIARAMAFNRANVKLFFDKFAEVRERHPSFVDDSRIYNLDESCTSTVQNTRKIIAPKGVKQVHQVKGAERGVSVTTCDIIGAYGTVLPPVHIFPRKKFVPDLMINCYPGALGLGNEKGYMTKETFPAVMSHFIKCTGATPNNPALLLLDNVESHFSTQTLDLAKNNGVTVLTFPPHCTHKMQPLDVGFFGPFKAYYDAAVNTYLANNPACPPTIYRVAGFVNDALLKAATPLNIIKSFQVTGIVPFNRDIFTDSDFMMAAVTLRSDPSLLPDGNQETTVSTPETPTPEASSAVASELIDDTRRSKDFVTPADIRGFPKAKPKEKQRKPRRKGKVMVATDTPEKAEISQREEQAELKKQQTEERKRKRLEKQAADSSKTRRTRRNTKRALTYESDNSEETDDVNNWAKNYHGV
ncbi:hypothetical protein FOCC_FOCC012980 [Frankliniella occidentalis]|nr:hypothetical protein FOCC_FOCC012980 [Frankliniella occidentalis]